MVQNWHVINMLSNGDAHVICDGEEVIWSPECLSLMQSNMLDNISIFTHNCGQRLVCGRLGSIASRMALDDNQATTIDGTRKGAGIIKSQGEVAHIQYYFAIQKWIEEWFMARGLTKKGYMKGENPDDMENPDDINFGDDEDLKISRTKTNIDFNKVHREVDHTQDQKFEEI